MDSAGIVTNCPRALPAKPEFIAINFLSSPIFLHPKTTLVNMLHREKVRKPSQGVEITYVNQNGYFPVWITSVEKSVDNVEKSCFSTGILGIFPVVRPPDNMHKRLHNFEKSAFFSCYVATGIRGLFPHFFTKKLAKPPMKTVFHPICRLPA
jgi:hypothetical protein